MDQGIWRSRTLRGLVEEKYHLSLGEGNTPLIEKNGIWFKREDLNPTGSVKDRGLVYQISWLNSLGVKKAVISSSGNAAISAANYARLANIELMAFLPMSASKEKIETLKALGCGLKVESDSLKKAGKYAQENGAYWIRPSINPEGQIGYMTLGEELIRDQDFDWLVFPVSSGTTAAGVYQGIAKLEKQLPNLLVVQTSQVNSIAGEYDQDFKKENLSLARGIVAKNSPRRNQIHQLIKATKGNGCVVDNVQIQKASDELHTWGMLVSFDAAVAWAGWKKFMEEENVTEKVCIVLTGKDRLKIT